MRAARGATIPVVERTGVRAIRQNLAGRAGGIGEAPVGRSEACKSVSWPRAVLEGVFHRGALSPLIPLKGPAGLTDDSSRACVLYTLRDGLDGGLPGVNRKMSLSSFWLLTVQKVAPITRLTAEDCGAARRQRLKQASEKA